jgi:hypothetical protein
MHAAQRLINHVALVLDGSYSMSDHQSKVVQVADEQIRHLARRSEELQQETRVSIYVFDDQVKCLIFDMDVMRLPSIKDLYRIDGNTALVDATMISQQELATTSQIHGEHGFLTFVITDGEENRSRRFKRFDLERYVATGLKPGWSLGFLVPGGSNRYASGREYMRRLGVPDDMIAEWDTHAADGFEGAGRSVRDATESFMTNRASGRGVLRSAFSTGADAVNAATVQAAALEPLSGSRYMLPRNGSQKIEMGDFFASNGAPYVNGHGYYQWTKTEDVQPQKKIAIVHKSTGKVYVDDAEGSPRVRDMIGMPKDITVHKRPDYNPEYDIFIQSTARNRSVLPGTRALIRL